VEKIELIQYREYKKNYQYDLMSEIKLLKNVIYITWSADIKKQAEKTLKNILNSNRNKKELESTILYSYTFMLCNYMKERPKTFDVIYVYLTDNKNNHMSIHQLKELSRQL